MKIVYFCDPHLRSTAPISRIDAFEESILSKIREIFDYAVDVKADCVICGGDLFDSGAPSIKTIIKLICLIKEYKDIPFYVNVGNHDIFAHQLSTLQTTACGILYYMNLIHIVDSVELNNIKINFVHYYHGAEEDLKIKDKFSKCDILVNHAMVLSESFFGDYVLYNEVNQDYRVMLCSHYHPGFGHKILENGDKHILACGGVTRTSLDQNNLTRQPSFAIIEIDEENVNCEIIPLKSAKPAEEVFLLQKALDPIDKSIKDQLLANINNLNLESCDLNTIIEHFCTINNIDIEIKKEILLRIG